MIAEVLNININPDFLDFVTSTGRKQCPAIGYQVFMVGLILTILKFACPIFGYCLFHSSPVRNL